MLQLSATLRCPAHAEATPVGHSVRGVAGEAPAAAQPNSLGTVTLQVLSKQRSPSTVTSTVVEK